MKGGEATVHRNTDFCIKGQQSLNGKATIKGDLTQSIVSCPLCEVVSPRLSVAHRFFPSVLRPLGETQVVVMWCKIVCYVELSFVFACHTSDATILR